MNVLRQVREMKTEFLENAKKRSAQRRADKEEYNRVYNEELRKAKLEVAKEKAQYKKQLMLREAREVAEAGGKFKAKAKKFFKAVRKYNEGVEARRKKRGGAILPMQR